MDKHMHTKEKIIKLISEGDNNLTTISKKLDLAPSTVSKHLHDLEDSGLIKQRGDTHIKKWKYYDLNPKVDGAKARNGQIRVSRVMIITATLMAILASIYIINSYVLYNKVSVGAIQVPVSITDPPQVPQGTQALYINYSSLNIQVDYK
jgi:DNA-binding transcriptional ArsR family regulator